MDDLMKCLYKFAMERRMGGLYEDPEYEEMNCSVKMQLKRVEENLSEEKRRELRLLLENLSAQSSIESEHCFQVALALSRELRALVR